VTDLATPGVHARARSGLRADVVVGTKRMQARLPEVERLAIAVGVPVTARTAWIRAQLDAAPGVATWFAGVLADARGLVAAAVVFEDDVLGPRLAGGGDGHRTAVIAVDEHAAEMLGRCVAAQADRRGHDGVVAELLQDDPRALAFAAGLGADVLPAPVVPVLVPDAGREVMTYLSHGTRKTLRKARNRLTVDGCKAELAFTRRGADIVAAFPQLERAHRARDERHGLPSLLDSAEGLTAWRARLRRLLEHRSLELATLVVDGELAAYVLGIPDGGWYRVLDGRIDEALARYAPGRLLEAAVLDRALASGFRGVDWMTSVAPESLLAANDAYPVASVTPRA
jgi:CelD/BcsL family acetyltransferase involved in cellulose biosynthesis